MDAQTVNSRELAIASGELLLRLGILIINADDSIRERYFDPAQMSLDNANALTTRILTLTHSSATLRALLTSSQSLWAKLVFQKTGVSYIHEGGDWREAYFDKEFCSQCPHLSRIAGMNGIKERAESPSALPAERQTIQSLISTFLSPEREPYISLRQEIQWNDQKNLERETLELKEEDVDLYFVEIGFMNLFREFVTCRTEPPGRIDNSVLLEGEDESEDMDVDGEENSLPRALKLRYVKPDLLPLRDFMIVNEENWKMLQVYHGGGPAVRMKEHIPENNPRYDEMLAQIEAYKREFQCVAQVLDEKELNAETDGIV
ncbi:UNVERIFIED_CONTAM: hypothetical protein HDU68_009449 [Siphonaria sp. JEL0065]|nr:hypothetical protein HDU68_009449 [Siphonaria sp. JEL0065]